MNRSSGTRAPALLMLSALAACNPSQPASNVVAGAQAPPLAGARIGGPFALTDQDAHAVTEKSWPGQYRIMYFGYTYCPDICPTDLQQIGAGLRAFEQQSPALAKRVQPIMISVDPQRDTPAVLKQYVAAFHPRLVGLTGAQPAITAVAKAYGVYSARRDNPGGEYLMDHSNQAYLMAPDGAPIALLPTDQGPQAVAAELAKWVR